jgi:ethanolamine utilization protein EutN
MPRSSALSTRSKSPPATNLPLSVQLAKVIGDVVITRKDANLAGVTLLVLQPIDPEGKPVGRTLVGVDAVGAGVGEVVFFVRGKEASFPFHPTDVPADVGIVGIVDHWDVG